MTQQLQKLMRFYVLLEHWIQTWMLDLSFYSFIYFNLLISHNLSKLSKPLVFRPESIERFPSEQDVSASQEESSVEA